MQVGVARIQLVRNWLHRECRFSFHVQEYRITPRRKSFPDAKKILSGCHANSNIPTLEYETNSIPDPSNNYSNFKTIRGSQGLDQGAVDINLTEKEILKSACFE